MIRLVITNGHYAIIRPQQKMEIITNPYAQFIIGLARTKQKLEGHKIEVLC